MRAPDHTAGEGFRPASPLADSSDQEQGLWRKFAEAGTPADFCQAWLTLQSQMLSGVRSGLVLLGTPDKGPFTPVAIWPSPAVSVKHLTGAAERGLRERRGLVLRAEPGRDAGDVGSDACQIVYPIDVSGKVHGAVVLELAERRSQELQAAMRNLHWGVAWLEVMVRRAEAVTSGEAYDQLRRVLDMVATVSEYEAFRPAAMGFVTRLSTALECNRVSIGFKKRTRLQISALSHSAEFDKRLNVVRAIESAMDEAIDQRAVILFPKTEDGSNLVTRAHANLAEEQGAVAICTVPLEQNGRIIGGLTLERVTEKPFDEATVEVVKTIAAMVGPILNTKREEARPLVAKIVGAGEVQLKRLTGPGHMALKTAVGVLCLLVLFFTFAKGDYRVTAPTSLEGTVQRTISAPFSGYVAEAPARPGNVVQPGDLLARLDDRDLKLERLKWATQKEQLEVQHGEAMAKHDRAQVGIIQAKIDQAEAQLSLLDEQLSRASVTAPFEGVVTSGDLSQSLGAPVERGQTLFEVAPLGGYRVILQVDERDIAEVKENQRGELALPSIPGKRFPLRITQITPVSSQKEGRNYFRAEAQLEEHSPRLRPGMEGIGKVDIDRRRLIWIWTHEVTEWISLTLWTWWP